MQCADESCTNITVVNDNVMEALKETFTVALEDDAGNTNITVNSHPSTVEITDDDGAL